MENENKAVLTDEDVLFLQEIDYIEIDEKQAELNDLISSVVRKNITKDFNQPELLKDVKFVENVEKEVKRKLNSDRYNQKNKDQLNEVVNSITFNILKQRYNLKPDENYQKEKLSKVKSVFSRDSVKTMSAISAPTSVKSLSLPGIFEKTLF